MTTAQINDIPEFFWVFLESAEVECGSQETFPIIKIKKRTHLQPVTSQMDHGREFVSILTPLRTHQFPENPGITCLPTSGDAPILA